MGWGRPGLLTGAASAEAEAGPSTGLGLSGLWLVRHGPCIDHLLSARHHPESSPVTFPWASAQVGGWADWPGGSGGRPHPRGSLRSRRGSREPSDCSRLVHAWSGRQQSGLSVTPGDWKWQWVREAEQFIRGEIRFQVLMDKAGKSLPGAGWQVWTGGPAVALCGLVLSLPGPCRASGPPAPREAQTYCGEGESVLRS